MANRTAAGGSTAATTAVAAAPSAPPPPTPPVSKPENMLPIMIVLGIMFVGICIAMNLFSRARFKKQRSRAFATTRVATPASRRSNSTTPKPMPPGFGQRLDSSGLGLGPSPQPSRCPSTSLQAADTSRHHSITTQSRSSQCRDRSQEDKL